MAKVYDPTERPPVEVSRDDATVFRKFGEAKMRGDEKAGAKLAAEAAFPPSLRRLVDTAFAELVELQAAAEGVDALRAQADTCEREVRRLMSLRPSGLDESERVQARIDQLHSDAAPLRQQLNDAQTAAMKTSCIASFLGDLLQQPGARAVRRPLHADTATASLAAELGVNPGPNGWQQLLRPDPRPRRRKWLRAIGG